MGCALSFLREIVAYYYIQNYVTPKSLNFFVGNSASTFMACSSTIDYQEKVKTEKYDNCFH